ncbi:RDD family protein [Clostridium sardiniense]|uniref:RDD family protein n=1 Tax=Clostridium sardiniense TaxID=29369 RepID=A0ABS7KZ46_CLOSR|nr:RDD family protein [Clostridium sardiniense]MBY0755857.1 RDD family protein [Clostridium sardiniense]MDQ0459915.1 hypothetical protein [Clostridium sardiniense]
MSKKEGMDINNQEDTNVEEVVESLELKKEEGPEEELVKEDIVVESTDEEEAEEKNKDKIIVEVDANPSFIKKLFSNILDQAVILGVSAILLLVFDLLIGFIGYMVVEPTSILLIIYVIVNILYFPIFEAKNIRTIGKRILGIG